MKIVALTDIHGSYDRAESILRREHPFDVLVIGGDLTTRGTPAEADRALRRFRSFDAPVLTVAGNMDPPELEATFDASAISINGKGIMVGNVGFCGVSGCPPTPLHTPYEISEEEIARRAERGWSDIPTAATLVFVPHAPPYRTTLDRLFTGIHVGSTSVRAFIEQRRPQVVICGHIHEAHGTETLGPTQMVNCGPAAKGHYAVITLGKTTTVQRREARE
jgi:hypothetical protein